MEGGGGGQDEEKANCGFYLRQEHRLILRHEESVSLNPDHSALWQLRIDFELPWDEEGGFKLGPCNGDKDRDGGECIFLFPLVYLKKQEGRIGIKVRDEEGRIIPLPTRTECDEISTAAIRQAIDTLVEGLPTDQREFDEEQIGQLLKALPAAKPYVASLALGDFERMVGIAPSEEEPEGFCPEVGKKIVDSNLPETLAMLVEHSLVWITLRGRPSERRSVVLSQEIALDRRAILRWSFGDLDAHEQGRKTRRQKILRAVKLESPWHWVRRSRLMRHLKSLRRQRASQPELMIGSRRFGRRYRRISFSALGERIGQPMAWMPFEFGLPTIYTKRCRSYHFEVRVPPGRTPRDVRMSHGPSLAEPPDFGASSELAHRDVRKTATTRSARVDLPRNALNDFLTFRVTVGIGDGAFPVLWFLAAAITAAMIWIFAASEPPQSDESAQIAAGILLIVPALIAGLAVASNDVPVSQLVGGARMLLLVTGLSAVVAVSALAGAKPFHMEPRWTFTASAMMATAAAVPLGTSWLLSRRGVWRLLMGLNSQTRQEAVLAAGIVAGLALSGVCIYLDKGLAVRGLVAGLLLMLTILMSTVANDRAALPMNQSRHYISLGFLLVGATCLILACIELSAVAGHKATRLQEWAERGAWALLLLASVSGDIVAWVTGFAKPRRDEVHVSPKVGKALLAQESVARLQILFERERQAKNREVPSVDPVQSTG